MEVRDFAEQVLFAASLEEKLLVPGQLTDDYRGNGIVTPELPGRPAELRFKAGRTGKSNIPSVQNLEQTGQRGRLLHFFANHELLATELMALVLLRFPEAPSAFRKAVLRTLQEEQQHTRWYLARMQQCGVAFGEFPLSGYFWRAISKMESPLDYVTGLSLTFEQANLDFARFYALGFAACGDQESAKLLERIYHDEIIHVACGLAWFRKWKDPSQSDWDAFRQGLRFPLSPQRAKGPQFNVEGRMAAGLDRQFIDQLSVFAQSKGRTPAVWLFNPFAEARIAQGPSFTPNKRQQLLLEDLEHLPQFLCRQDDVVLVRRRPALRFLSSIREAGYAIPEFAELSRGGIDPNSNLAKRKLGALRPWAWAPDSLELLGPLFPNVTLGDQTQATCYNEKVARFYSKEWSSGFLKKMLNDHSRLEPQSDPLATDSFGADTLDWLCREADIGVGVSTLSEALEQIHRIRARGHHEVIVKESLGAAGHNAIRLLEPELLHGQRRWMEQALDHGKGLIIEPWFARVTDFSIQLEMTKNGLKLIGYAGLINDWKGQYRGNSAAPHFRRQICPDLSQLLQPVPDLARLSQRVYLNIFLALKQELQEMGYYGPVGIDAFVYKTKQGECRLKPIVEINPRFTMGRLTLELMRNVAPGSTGVFRLLNRQDIQSLGFHDFVSWSRSIPFRFPLKYEGEPVPRIRSGALCLTDPEVARVCVALFEVTSPVR